MRIILADAELELVPDGLKDDVEVKDFLKKLGKENALLDNHLMRHAIRKHFPDQAERVGFPFSKHYALLCMVSFEAYTISVLPASTTSGLWLTDRYSSIIDGREAVALTVNGSPQR